MQLKLCSNKVKQNINYGHGHGHISLKKVYDNKDAAS